MVLTFCPALYIVDNMMDLKPFYDVIRKKFKLTDENVKGFDLLIHEGIKKEVPLEDLSYMLATTWLETAHTMQPIKEYGSDARFHRLYDIQGERPKVAKLLGNDEPGDGVKYPGRGYVQLTGKGNYKKAGYLLDQDLVGNPDLALDPEIAAWIMFNGMEQGWFTGKKLDDYIDHIDESDTEDEREYKEARRVINGTDKAELIATYAMTIEEGLRAIGYTTTHIPEIPVEPSPDPVEDGWILDGIDDSELDKIDPKGTAGLLAAIFNILLKFFKGK